MFVAFFTVSNIRNRTRFVRFRRSDSVQPTDLHSSNKHVTAGNNSEFVRGGVQSKYLPPIFAISQFSFQHQHVCLLPWLCFTAPIFCMATAYGTLYVATGDCIQSIINFVFIGTTSPTPNSILLTKAFQFSSGPRGTSSSKTTYL